MTPSRSEGVPEPALFELDQSVVGVGELSAKRDGSGILSSMRDKQRVARLERLVGRLRHAANPLDQAQIAAEVRDLAEAIVAETIREANRAGQTWREIAAHLGIPFQTLYRRYGGNEGS